MTGQEMIQSFGLNYADEINASVAGWEDDEILAFLNQAQDDIVTMLCVAKTYDKIEKLRNKELVSFPTNDPTNISKTLWTVPSDYYWIITSRAKVTRSQLPKCTDVWFGCRDFNGRTEFVNKYTVC